MRIEVAKSAGFCFGVKRAVNKVYEKAEKQTKVIYTYGFIIHNEEVVRDLQEKGVRVIHTKEELTGCRDGLVVIRSHGVPKEIYHILKQEQIEFIDATCPFVLKIHRIVEAYTRKGCHIIIVGDNSHPEVEGIRGWCNEDAVTVVSGEEEARDFSLKKGEPFEKKVCIVAQTTFNNNKFQEIVEIIQKKGYDIIVLNTICDATFERQTEAKAIARQVDAMIVIGGRNSSNTQKLFEICEKECENTYYIQTLDDLDVSKIQSMDSVGITAGASTPNNIIEEVQKNVRNEF